MRLRDAYVAATKLRELVETEFETAPSYERPLSRRLWLWRRGFLTKSDAVYDFDRWDPGEFLTDFERYVRTKGINGEWNVTLDNKLVFHWMLEAFDRYRVGVYGVLRSGRFVPVDELRRGVADGGTSEDLSAGRGRSADAVERVDALLDEHDRVVLKWVKGGGGENVYLCSRDGDGYVVNGERRSEASFADLVDGLEQYLVCEFVEQSEFGERLFPRTTNTVRVITMYDEDAGEAFVPIAIYRIGTERSYPMDNFGQGGLTAEVDVETGELGPAVQLPPTGDPVERPTHPDTGIHVEGAQMPAWPTVRDRLLEMAEAYQHVPYIGWDVVPTDGAGEFAVIEGNSYPGMKSLQVHRPLLADGRARRFYERHGVVRR